MNENVLHAITKLMNALKSAADDVVKSSLVEKGVNLADYIKADDIIVSNLLTRDDIDPNKIVTTDDFDPDDCLTRHDIDPYEVVTESGLDDAVRDAVENHDWSDEFDTCMNNYDMSEYIKYDEVENLIDERLEAMKVGAQFNAELANDMIKRIAKVLYKAAMYPEETLPEIVKVNSIDEAAIHPQSEAISSVTDLVERVTEQDEH